MSDRLSNTDPRLSDSLGAAAPELRSRAATLAAQAAVSSTNLNRDDRFVTLDPHDLPGLRALVETLDNEYFDLQDKLELGQTSESSVDHAFGKARSASSLVFLAEGQTNEAIYEALSAVPDPTAILTLIERALTQST